MWYTFCMSKFFKTAKAAVRWNCRILNVPEPIIRAVDPAELQTKTTRCALSLDGSRIAISQDFINSNPGTAEVWLALSHECRHIWQIHHTEYMSSYKPSSALSVSEYNQQAAEIDAWAWAVVVLSDRFGVRPTLEENLGVDVWLRIVERANEISE